MQSSASTRRADLLLPRLPLSRGAGGTLARSIPLGLLGGIFGRPFNPLSRAISSRSAAFSAVRAAILSSASISRRRNSSMPLPSRSGGDPVMNPRNRDSVLLRSPRDHPDSICRTGPKTAIIRPRTARPSNAAARPFAPLTRYFGSLASPRGEQLPKFRKSAAVRKHKSQFKRRAATGPIFPEIGCADYHPVRLSETAARGRPRRANGAGAPSVAAAQHQRSAISAGLRSRRPPRARYQHASRQGHVSDARGVRRVRALDDRATGARRHRQGARARHP